MGAEPAGKPVFHEDGSVRVPAFTLPPSRLLSEAALQLQQMRAKMPVAVPEEQEPDIAVRRREIDEMMVPRLAMLRQRYAVDMVDERIGGVPVRIVTPAGGGHAPDRVLINLHGGGFTVGWESCALIEAIPIAALGRFKVVTVDYRMSPEFGHPAAVEDAGAVYRALLEQYAPAHIGIYGGSAGGVLTAQTSSWILANGLPQAAAVGIFGAGAVPFDSGESAYVAGYIDASFPPPPADGSPPMDITRGYFDGVDKSDPIAWPGFHPDVLAQFPPTLIITGTRAMDLSPAIYTNSQLLKAGVRSTLIVGEGMGHCYYYMAHLPEAQDAIAAIIAFFREHLR